MSVDVQETYAIEENIMGNSELVGDNGPIPYDCLEEVFKNLRAKDLCRASAVCT